jgi:hypothetical protein
MVITVKYLQYCVLDPSPPEAIGLKPELELQFATGIRQDQLKYKKELGLLPQFPVIYISIYVYQKEGRCYLQANVAAGLQ